MHLRNAKHAALIPQIMAACCMACVRTCTFAVQKMQLHLHGTWLSASQGKGHEVKSKLKNDLKPTVIANWKLWVPAQFINFRLVPPHLQVCSALQRCAKQLESHHCVLFNHINRQDNCQWGSAFMQCNLSNVRERFQVCQGLRVVLDCVHMLVHGLLLQSVACMWF